MALLLRRFWRDDEGQNIAEYAVILAVILVVVVGTLHMHYVYRHYVYRLTAPSFGSKILPANQASPKSSSLKGMHTPLS